MNKCFKRIVAIFSVIAIIGATFMGCGKVNNKRTESTNLKTIRLNEVVRSVFYAPMYVAINEGFFEEANSLKIRLLFALFKSFF